MTDRSRANEETPKWVQTVASVRGELMTRFSDRLSMEEIASCAYAVAMRDGQGGTGMVEEERSRFEKWALEEWHDCEYTNSIDTDYRDADTAKMWDAWQARAALEDRQEAAGQEELARREGSGAALGDFAIWLKDNRHLTMWEALCECERRMCHYDVPSEATPSKEFIGTVRRRLFIPVDHEWNGVVREVTAKHESGEMVPVTAVLDDLAAFYRRRATLANFGQVIHEDDCDCANDSDADGNVVEHSEDCKNCTCEKSAPAPEVQGTPTKESEPIWRKCPQCGRENSVATWAMCFGKCPNCHDLHDREMSQ